MARSTRRLKSARRSCANRAPAVKRMRRRRVLMWRASLIISGGQKATNRRGAEAPSSQMFGAAAFLFAAAREFGKQRWALPNPEFARRGSRGLRGGAALGAHRFDRI